MPSLAVVADGEGDDGCGLLLLNLFRCAVTLHSAHSSPGCVWVED